MKPFSFLGLGMMVWLAVACSSSGGDGDAPVAKSALTGSIGGKTFEAVSATATPGFGAEGSRRIEIYASEVGCDAFGGGDGSSLILEVPWQDGFESALGLDQSVTFYTPPGENNVATEGRIEVVAAPAEGERGTVRVRAYIDEANQVEGEIEVQVCADPFAT